jgi:hypothetical protein
MRCPQRGATAREAFARSFSWLLVCAAMTRFRPAYGPSDDLPPRKDAAHRSGASPRPPSMLGIGTRRTTVCPPRRSAPARIRRARPGAPGYPDEECVVHGSSARRIPTSRGRTGQERSGRPLPPWGAAGTSQLGSVVIEASLSSRPSRTLCCTPLHRRASTFQDSSLAPARFDHPWLVEWFRRQPEVVNRPRGLGNCPGVTER